MVSFYDLVRVTTPTVGTGTLALGPAVSGFLSFSGAGVTDGATVAYGIQDLGNSETGTGVYSASAQTLTRTVTASTNGGAAISLTGNAQVSLVVRAEDVPPARATAQSTPGNPTAITSTTLKMLGLAGSFTPTRTGNALIIISGNVVTPSDLTAGHGLQYQISYGTGGAPSNGAALTGTQVGATQEYTNSTTVTVSTDLNEPVSIQAVVTGLPLGTAQWIDLAAKYVGSGGTGFSINNPSVTVREI